MLHKSLDLYYTLFFNIKTILIILNIEINFEKIDFMLDFEKRHQNKHLLEYFQKALF